MSSASGRSARQVRPPGGPAPPASPTLRRWELAARLRELRLRAGRSVDEVAAELMCSAAKISRMETAGRGVQPRDVRDLARFYGLDPSTYDELMHLAEEAKKPGWWQRYRTLDDQLAHFIGLEASATEVRVVNALVIPAMLQTVDYSLALIEGTWPPGELQAQQRQDSVEVRQRRQERLGKEGFHFSFVIDESVLLRRVGSVEIMAAQVKRLAEIADLPSVTLQVVPLAYGSYPALQGSFQWMRFGANQLGDVVFVEGLLGLQMLDKAEDVDRYRAVHAHVASKVALSPEATRARLDDLLVR